MELFDGYVRERIRRRTCKTREEARQDVFDYIETSYNPVRKQVRNGMLSPVEVERHQMLKAQGVQKTSGYAVHAQRAANTKQAIEHRRMQHRTLAA